MSRMIKLEEFEVAAGPGGPVAKARITHEDLDAQVRAAYEQGYAAGFDDAVRQESDTRKHITAEFARNLQDLGFTFHEARTHVLRGLETLMDQISSTLLPAIAHEALGPLILQEVMQVAEKCADREIELLIPVGTMGVVTAIAADAGAIPLRIVEEPSLAPGQALLRAGRVERSIDLTGAVDRIAQAISALYSNLQGDLAHG